MGQNSAAPSARMPTENTIRDFPYAIGKQPFAEDTRRIVLEGVHSVESIVALCRRNILQPLWQTGFTQPKPTSFPGNTFAISAHNPDAAYQ